MATLSAPPLGLPFDVRLMNGVASLLYLLIGAALLAAALLWLSRSPWFAIRVIQLEGDLQRNNVRTLRANAAPRLAGNFFSSTWTGPRRLRGRALGAPATWCARLARPPGGAPEEQHARGAVAG